MNFTHEDLDAHSWIRQATLPVAEADRLLTVVEAHPDMQRRVWAFNKLQPRDTGWYEFGYSANSRYRTAVAAPPFPSELRPLLEEISLVAERPFNAGLVNYYRDDNDSVAWHDDNERHVADIDPVIASISFGATRDFQLKPKGGGSADILTYRLGHGDVLIMGGNCQLDFDHQVPKSDTPVGQRWNLTLRNYTPPRWY